MKRLNITLPENLAQELEAISNKSRFIAEAVKEKLERIRREKLDKLLVEGYKEACKEDREVDREWEEVTLESWK